MTLPTGAAIRELPLHTDSHAPHAPRRPPIQADSVASPNLMSLLFDLADPGTRVDYTVSSSDPGVLAVHTAATDPALAGPVLRLAPMTAGEATVTVVAEAAGGGAAAGRVAASPCAGGVRLGRPHGLGRRRPGPARRRPARAGGPDGRRRVPPVPPALTSGGGVRSLPRPLSPDAPGGRGAAAGRSGRPAAVGSSAADLVRRATLRIVCRAGDR